MRRNSTQTTPSLSDMGHMTSRLQPGYVNLSLSQSHTRTEPKEHKISEGVRRSIGLWRALPATLGAILWSTQMMYFLFWFVSRPPLSDGAWPRIGPSYAAFPFISCVGAVRELSFKAVSIIVAILLWIAFGIDFFVGRQSSVGKFWRLGKLILSSVSSVFLIALSFASVDVSSLCSPDPGLLQAERVAVAAEICGCSCKKAAHSDLHCYVIWVLFRDFVFLQFQIEVRDLKRGDRICFVYSLRISSSFYHTEILMSFNQ